MHHFCQVILNNPLLLLLLQSTFKANFCLSPNTLFFNTPAFSCSHKASPILKLWKERETLEPSPHWREMFMVSFSMFAVTAEENKPLLKTSLSNKKRAVQPRKQGRKKTKETCRLETAAMKQGLPLLRLVVCDPGRVHCVTEREWFGTNFEKGTATASPLRLIRAPLTLKCICSTSLITAPLKKTMRGHWV